MRVLRRQPGPRLHARVSRPRPAQQQQQQHPQQQRGRRGDAPGQLPGQLPRQLPRQLQQQQGDRGHADGARVPGPGLPAGQDEPRSPLLRMQGAVSRPQAQGPHHVPPRMEVPRTGLVIRNRAPRMVKS